MGAAAAVAGIGAVASLAGGLMQSQAVGKGQAAAQAALAQSREDLAPWRETGANALTVAGNLAGANGPDAAQTALGDFYTSPGYQWRLDEGMRTVDSAAAARGMLRSGSTLKEEQRHAQGLASQEFENYYNRLYNLSGQGLTAGQAGAGIAANSANAALGGANAQSSIYGNTASALGTVAGGLVSNPQFQGWLGGSSMVSPTEVGNNALYQQAAFNQQPAGTYGPWQR